MSEGLPATGRRVADASSGEMGTQRESASPPSSETIVGSAGATSVMLSDATSEPSIRPAKTAMTPRSTPGVAFALAALEATAVTYANLPRTRQSQHPFGEDVAQHFGSPGLDRVGARPQELVLPSIAVANLRGRPGDVHRRLGHALVELRPHQLEDRSLGARNAAALDGRHRAVAVELQGPRLDGVLRDL